MTDQHFKTQYKQIIKEQDEEIEEIKKQHQERIKQLSKNYLRDIIPFKVGDIIWHKTVKDRKFVIKSIGWRSGFIFHGDTNFPDWIYDCIELTKNGKEKKHGGKSSWSHSLVEKVK